MTDHEDRAADAREELLALALLDAAGEADAEDRARLDALRAADPDGAAEAAALAATGASVKTALDAAGDPPADLAGRIAARIAADPQRVPARRPSRLRALPSLVRRFAIAAAVLLVVGMTVEPVLSGRWWWSRGTPRTPDTATEEGFAAFAEATAAAGIDFVHHAPAEAPRFMAESTGGGVVAADLDGDGAPDLLLLDAWPLEVDRPAGAGHRLYRNRGDGTFTDATAGSGLDTVPERGAGAVAADLDGDGDRDLVIAGYGRLRILANDGAARFTDVTDAAGFDDDPSSWYTTVVVADFDGDAVLDVFAVRYADQAAWVEQRRRFNLPSGEEGQWRGVPVFAGPEPLVPQTDRLLRGRGDLRFEDVSDGLADQEARYGFQALATDADGDGRVDIYVANDTHPNTLWLNLGGGRFRDVALEAGAAFDASGRAQAGMGAAAADLDGDGLPEIVVTNFSQDHHTLYRNVGASGIPAFEDRTHTAGLAAATHDDLGWGVVFADLDLDGHDDLVVANGHLYPQVERRPELATRYRQRLKVHRGLADGRFEDRTETTGRGFSTPRVHRGLAAADFDGDGRVDLVATVLGGAPVLLRNTTPPAGRSWIGFRLRGTASPRDPAGALVTVWAAGRRHTRELRFGGSFGSMSEPVLRFGLGDAREVDRIVVRWPSGRTEEMEPRPSGRVHELVETP